MLSNEVIHLNKPRLWTINGERVKYLLLILFILTGCGVSNDSDTQKQQQDDTQPTSKLSVIITHTHNISSTALPIETYVMGMRLQEKDGTIISSEGGLSIFEEIESHDLSIADCSVRFVDLCAEYNSMPQYSSFSLYHPEVCSEIALQCNGVYVCDVQVLASHDISINNGQVQHLRWGNFHCI